MSNEICAQETRLILDGRCHRAKGHKGLCDLLIGPLEDLTAELERVRGERDALKLHPLDAAYRIGELAAANRELQARVDEAVALLRGLDDALENLTMTVFNPTDVKNARLVIKEDWPALLAILQPGDDQ